MSIPIIFAIVTISVIHAIWVNFSSAETMASNVQAIFIFPLNYSIARHNGNFYPSPDFNVFTDDLHPNTTDVGMRD